MARGGLTEIEQAHLASLVTDGELTPAAVVADARRPSSPLHHRFDWDVERAAAKYLLEQARSIISMARVTIEIGETSIICPAYIRDPSKQPSQQGYRATIEIRDEHEQARVALTDELRRVESALARAELFAAAFGLSAEIAAWREQVDDAIQKLLPSFDASV